MNRTKWRTVIFALIVLFALMAAACSSSEDADEPQAVEPAPTSTPADEPEPAPTSAPADEPAVEPDDQTAPEPEEEPGDEPAPEPEPTPEPTPIPVPDGSTVGITDDTIKIAVLRSDTKALEDAGILPDVGDLNLNYQTFADLASAGGRNVEVVFHSFPPGASPTDQQAACIAATEDDQVAVVHFVGGLTAEVVLCATEGHERIAYMLSGILPQEIYDRSNGLLFSQSMTTERLVATWPGMLDTRGMLEGRTLGLMRGDIGEHEVAAEVLKAALAEAGYELADEVALPCEGSNCTQLDLGVERMKSAGVDLVFSLVPPSPFSIAVFFADEAGWETEWVVSDIENLAYNSVGQAVYRRYPDLFDGMIGLTYGLDRLSEDVHGRECNAQFSEVTGVVYEEGVDAWSAVVSTCLFIQNLVAAADWSQDRYGTVNQTTLVQGFETLTDYKLGDITGSWSQEKHDAPDVVTLKEFEADCLCWYEIEGTRLLLDQ